jgi:hypothetical protein
MGTTVENKKAQGADFISDVKEKTKEYVDISTVDSAVAKARGLLDEGTKQASELYAQSREKIEHNVRSHPVIALAAAFAAGIATVALIRVAMASSSKE